MLSYASGSADL